MQGKSGTWIETSLRFNDKSATSIGKRHGLNRDPLRERSV